MNNKRIANRARECLKLPLCYSDDTVLEKVKGSMLLNSITFNLAFVEFGEVIVKAFAGLSKKLKKKKRKRK